MKIIRDNKLDSQLLTVGDSTQKSVTVTIKTLRRPYYYTLSAYSSGVLVYTSERSTK
jgi:hypothetical protein